MLGSAVEKDCFIVDGPGDVSRYLPQGMRDGWILQELVYGSSEYSVSLLVLGGCIRHAIGMMYEYGSDAYVYPNVRKLGKHLWEVLHWGGHAFERCIQTGPAHETSANCPRMRALAARWEDLLAPSLVFPPFFSESVSSNGFGGSVPLQSSGRGGRRVDSRCSLKAS